MNLAATVALRKPIKPTIPRAWAYGTSEGVTKAWDTRGRGRNFTLPNGRQFEVSNDHAEQDGQLAKIRMEELAKLPAHVQEAFKRGIDTEGIHRDGKEGPWSPERQALHDQIVAGFLEGHTPQANPHLEIVAGGTASGKSAASAEVKGRLGDFLYVNTDNVRAMLPEVGAFVGNDKSGLLQEEAGYIRDRILSAASDSRLNIVLDAPGSHGIVNFAKTVEDAGYTVGVNYVHRDESSAENSAIDRKYNATDLSDLREVPRYVTFNSHAKARGSIGALSSGSREFRVYDNEGRNGLVYHRDTSGNTRVYNGERLGVIAHGQDKRLPEISDSTFSH